MMIGINYANEKFKPAQSLNTWSLLHKGKCDRVIEYSPEMIDSAYKEAHRSILQSKRGDGYWLWKPYFILNTLEQLNEGDYLFYCDSGAVVLKPLRHLVEAMEKENQSVMVFQLSFPEKMYTKRDAFVLMGCDNNPDYYESKQRLAGYILIKKSHQSLEIVRAWLRYCEDERIISDSDNVMGELNYPGFIENRHDMSVWSLITKKYGIPAFVDPSQWGIKRELFDSDARERSNYPIMVDSHRSCDLGSWLRYKVFRMKRPWVR